MALFRKDGILTVSDLAQPLWCEHKAYYNLVGLKKKGSKKRPMEFQVIRNVVVEEVIKVKKPAIEMVETTSKENDAELTKEGPPLEAAVVPAVMETVVKKKIVQKKVTMKVSKRAVHKAEKHIARGQAIHESLDVQVKHLLPLTKFNPKNRAELEGERIVKFLFGLLNLKHNKISREIPVFGVIHGIPINGRIDELRLEPSKQHPGKFILIVREVKTVAKRMALKEDVMREHQIQAMLYKCLLDRMLSPFTNWETFFKRRLLGTRMGFDGKFKDQVHKFATMHGIPGLSLFSRNLKGVIRSLTWAIAPLGLQQNKIDVELGIVYRKLNPSTKG
ncbi:hypothetical protein M408DRAFT_6440 [Serendipita vermifera MAFF 305830]|uniref:Uncharacterized protein n=1 Tax=Serendipita vermifera MAFF 305830 TaxID=933852 RepID=A0A0C3B5J0_SERVB|nr:hypothetical protein M408DRAFT_6440 [Serendipita vermifera MAFF 305830]